MFLVVEIQDTPRLNCELVSYFLVAVLHKWTQVVWEDDGHYQVFLLTKSKLSHHNLILR